MDTKNYIKGLVRVLNGDEFKLPIRYINYETFLKLVGCLKQYVGNHNSIMCSPYRIQKHLLPGICYQDAQMITQHYRLCLKDRYSLDRLVLMIILCRYDIYVLFENSKSEVIRTKDLIPIEQWHSIPKCIIALEKFMKRF